jgi:hypothetical protein
MKDVTRRWRKLECLHNFDNLVFPMKRLMLKRQLYIILIGPRLTSGLLPHRMTFPPKKCVLLCLLFMPAVFFLTFCRKGEALVGMLKLEEVYTLLPKS